MMKPHNIILSKYKHLKNPLKRSYSIKKNKNKNKEEKRKPIMKRKLEIDEENIDAPELKTEKKEYIKAITLNEDQNDDINPNYNEDQNHNSDYEMSSSNESDNESDITLNESELNYDPTKDDEGITIDESELEGNEIHKNDYSLRRNRKRNPKYEEYIENDLSCINCGDEFKNEKALSKHMKTCRITSFSCTKCGNNYKTKSGLQSHINNIHTGKHKNQQRNRYKRT